MYALVTDSAAPIRIARHVVPEPIPASGEVIVDVRAISLNRGEVRMLGTAADGWRPGWDFAGVLRTDIDNGPRAGARVVGISAGRSWAERVAVPAGWVAPRASAPLALTTSSPMSCSCKAASTWSWNRWAATRWPAY